MVNWNSPEEIQRDAVAFVKFMHALLGLYIWEWMTSLSFDWQYVTGKKKFRWPMIFYFWNRYSLLLALIGIAIASNVASEINCQVLYTFNQVVGNFAIGTASINLAVRTMAIWSQNAFVVGPLVIIILGHWSLLLHGILLKAAWVPGQGCVITETNSRLLAATFIYTMIFDLVVLLLTAFKLVFDGGRSPSSRLAGLIFGDGLIYFAIAFVANLIATIFMLLDLNPVMSIIANVPAAIASSIVSCRAVRRLSDFDAKAAGPQMFPSTTQSSTLAFRSGASVPLRPKLINTSSRPAEGVHVQMETFESPADSKTCVTYDTADRKAKGDDYDPESQGTIGNDFKDPY